MKLWPANCFTHNLALCVCEGDTFGDKKTWQDVFILDTEVFKQNRQKRAFNNRILLGYIFFFLRKDDTGYLGGGFVYIVRRQYKNNSHDDTIQFSITV